MFMVQTSKLQLARLSLLWLLVSCGIHAQMQQMSFGDFNQVTDENNQGNLPYGVGIDYVDGPPTEYNSDLDWSYDKSGTDWNETYEFCGSKKFSQQSPSTLNISNPKNKDWSTEAFAFVPYFFPSQIASASVANYTFSIQIDENSLQGKFFGVQAVEPQSLLHHYVKWETNQIQFHYPAEHVWAMTNSSDGSNITVTADLEMQIYGFDSNGEATACKNSKTGILSLFFFLDENGSEETDKFFKFQEKPATDLSGSALNLEALVNSSTSLFYPIYGYVGTLSQPPCTSRACWYLLQRKLPIKQAQLDYFKIQGVDSNARKADQGSSYKDFDNQSIFGSNDEIVGSKK